MQRAEPLARLDTNVKPIRRRRQRACPSSVVGARGLIREVEVEHQSTVFSAQVGALHGVQDTAAGPVGLIVACRVGEGDEQAAAVSLQPVQVELDERPVE
jgi:hypothetical protein